MREPTGRGADTHHVDADPDPDLAANQCDAKVQPLA
jgi:hypothetical protein